MAPAPRIVDTKNGSEKGEEHVRQMQNTAVRERSENGKYHFLSDDWKEEILHSTRTVSFCSVELRGDLKLTLLICY